MERVHVSTTQREQLVELLQRHIPGKEVWAYGSRVKGTHRPHSDLDLVVFTPSNIIGPVNDLREALDESSLPFRVDVHVWEDLPREFQTEIERLHEVVIPARETKSASHGFI